MNKLKKIKFRFLCLLAGLALLMPLTVAAELAVIVNPESGVKQLSKSQVINIFLGRHRELPGKIRALPIDLQANNNEKTFFYRALVNREPDQMAAYWARLVFAGSTQPPMQVTSEADVMRFVSKIKGGIGYVDQQRVDERVRVVFILK